jgi:hypothetical protein
MESLEKLRLERTEYAAGFHQLDPLNFNAAAIGGFDSPPPAPFLFR